MNECFPSKWCLDLCVGVDPFGKTHVFKILSVYMADRAGFEPSTSTFGGQWRYVLAAFPRFSVQMKPGTPIAEGQDPRRVSIAGLSQRPLHIAPQYARELVSWRVTLGRMLPQGAAGRAYTR